MSGYIEGVDREQVTLFPERLEDWICEDHPVRVIDALSMRWIFTTPGSIGRHRLKRAGRDTTLVSF